MTAGEPSITTLTQGPASPGPRRERAVLDTRPPMRPRTPLRAAVLIVVIGVLGLGVVYPLVVTGIAQAINPAGANGSLVAQNGTLVGSSLVGQNLSLPYLFWDRVSLIDYNTTQGANYPYGPTEPALAAWLNETERYLRTDWNLSLNQSLPLDLIAPSYSGFDPYLVPAGVLIQVPRVAHAIANITNVSFEQTVGVLTTLINQNTQMPFLGTIGEQVVNVVTLDLALINYAHIPV